MIHEKVVRSHLPIQMPTLMFEHKASQSNAEKIERA